MVVGYICAAMRAAEDIVVERRPVQCMRPNTTWTQLTGAEPEYCVTLQFEAVGRIGCLVVRSRSYELMQLLQAKVAVTGRFTAIGM